jgi:hypothetical protein
MHRNAKLFAFSRKKKSLAVMLRSRGSWAFLLHAAERPSWWLCTKCSSDNRWKYSWEEDLLMCVVTKGFAHASLLFCTSMEMTYEETWPWKDHGRDGVGSYWVTFWCRIVDDDDWMKLHSFFITLGIGGKIVIIRRHQSLARFGSVKPIFLTILSYDESS